MKAFVLIFTLLFPFALAYLIKENELSFFSIFILVILFTILIVSYLSTNNKQTQFSLKSVLIKTKKKN